jgi:large subunit ribosomal protein L23
MILKKPLVTEKSSALLDKKGQYGFVVDHKASKDEIKKAVENKFGVKVEAVNTTIRPAKNKARVVKGKYVHGKTSLVKKAYVTVAEGDFIEGFYGETAELEQNSEA